MFWHPLLRGYNSHIVIAPRQSLPDSRIRDCLGDMGHGERQESSHSQLIHSWSLRLGTVEGGEDKRRMAET